MEEKKSLIVLKEVLWENKSREELRKGGSERGRLRDKDLDWKDSIIYSEWQNSEKD